MNDRKTAIIFLKTLLNKFPHKKFTSKKLWIEIGRLLLRDENLLEMRSHFGKSIGLTPLPKIIKEYASIE